MTALPLQLSDGIFQSGRGGHSLDRMGAATRIFNLLLGLIICPLLYCGNVCERELLYKKNFLFKVRTFELR